MRLFVLFLLLLALVFWSGDGEASEAQVFFESSHYRDAFYGVGDAIEVIVVGFSEPELPDSAEVTLVSALGDSQIVRLEAAGSYYRASWTELPGFWWEKSLRGSIGSVGSNTVGIANGILEVDPQSDQIVASYVPFTGSDSISGTISIGWIRTEVVNNRKYEYWKGTWYIYDLAGWYEVSQYGITVKFAPAVTQDTIDSFNSEKGVSVIRVSSHGYYDLRIPEGSDPIEMIRQYLESGIVESAEVGGTGVYCETTITPTTWGELKSRIGSSSPLRAED